MSDKYKDIMFANWIQITNELLELDYSLKSELVAHIALTKKKENNTVA